MLGNFLVHQWLGQRRRVLLVVAELAKADDVDDHIFLEFHPEFQRQLGCQHHGFRIVAMDMQHRCFNHFDHVGAVQRGAAIARITSGETDLVVDHEVNRSTRRITTCFGQRQCFHHNALPRKSGVAMHQHRQDLQAFGVGTAIHTGANRAFDNRIDNLKVRRIECQRQMNRTARSRHIGAEALVILHVATRQIFRRRMIKLGKKISRHFAQRVNQHVQTTAMCHANNDFLHANFAATLDQLVHAGDKTFAALQRKTFLPHVFGVQKALQTLRRSQTIQQVEFFFF